jgi:hypothetical protein
MASGTRQDNTLYVGRYAESLGLKLPCSDEFAMNSPPHCPGPHREALRGAQSSARCGVGCSGGSAMIKQYGHATWAAIGAFGGGALASGLQRGPPSIVIGVVVGALFGAALRG